jgi:hypothetical protein
MTDKFEIFLHTLGDATKKGTIKWGSAVQQDTFRIALGEGLVRIEQMYDPEDQSIGYGVFLLDRQGNTVENLFGWGGPELNWLQDLYIAARRSAFDIDKLIDSMVKDLKEGKTRPLPTEPPEPKDFPF